jgi:ribosomal-protein-alanine N-acetyltransferase
MTERPRVRVEPALAPDLPQLSGIAEVCGLQVDFAAELVRSYALLRVARGEGALTGFALAWRAADELHLTDLGVDPRHRRQGIARQLVLELLTEARVAALRIALLEVRASNVAALALYGGLGFVELDRRRRYYSEPEEDAVVMQLELR